MQWYVYIMECGDGTLYTGVTTNIEKRLAVHNSGKGAKYTAVRLPILLRWSQQCASRSDALKQEWAIKSLTRTQKEKMIMGQ